MFTEYQIDVIRRLYIVLCLKEQVTLDSMVNRVREYFPEHREKAQSGIEQALHEILNIE